MEAGDGPATWWQEEKAKQDFRSGSERVFSPSFLQLEGTVVQQQTWGSQKPGKQKPQGRRPLESWRSLRGLWPGQGWECKPALDEAALEREPPASQRQRVRRMGCRADILGRKEPTHVKVVCIFIHHFIYVMIFLC